MAPDEDFGGRLTGSGTGCDDAVAAVSSFNLFLELFVARLNVEDEILYDERFKALARALGSEDTAMGFLLRFWRIAQKHWGQGELVPEKTFRVGGFELLLEVDFAEKRPDGVYARGAEKYFSWYRQRVDAGKKRGSSHRNPNGTFSSGRPADDQRNTNTAGIPDQPLTLALTLDKKTRERAAKKNTPSPEDQTWPESDPMAKVFSNLRSFPAYWAIFVREKERGVILEHMDRSSLTIQDMEQVTFELKCWVDGHPDPIKSPRGKLATFVANYAKRKPPAEKRKSLFETYGLDKGGNPRGA